MITGTILLVSIIAIFRNILDRRVKIEINTNHIFYYQWFHLMEWDIIVATYVKTIFDDTDSHELIVHYYDKILDEFKNAVLKIDGFDSNYIDIAFAVEYCKIKHELLQNK